MEEKGKVNLVRLHPRPEKFCISNCVQYLLWEIAAQWLLEMLVLGSLVHSQALQRYAWDHKRHSEPNRISLISIISGKRSYRTTCTLKYYFRLKRYRKKDMKDSYIILSMHIIQDLMNFCNWRTLKQIRTSVMSHSTSLSNFSSFLWITTKVMNKSK